MDKRSLGPVVATTLFLVIVITVAVAFQNWWGSYSSGLFTEVENESSDGSFNTKIEKLVGTQLYFYNGYEDDLSISEINVDENDCGVSTTVSNGVSSIALQNNCTQNLTRSSPEVIVYTDKGTYSKYVFVTGVTFTSSEDEGDEEDGSSPNSTNYTGYFSGYAYNEHMGYISFNGSEYGVNSSNSSLSGYAYSENLGYISFNGTGYGVNISDDYLVGYAYGDTIGYIIFNSTQANVTFDGSELGGYAYSEGYGYIHLANSPTYEVTYD